MLFYDFEILLSFDNNLLGRMKILMTLGVLKVFFAMKSIEIRFFLILLRLKDLPDLGGVSFG